jgi:hypothetical protein
MHAYQIVTQGFSILPVCITITTARSLVLKKYCQAKQVIQADRNAIELLIDL